MYLPWNASRARLAEARQAQNNRLEIVGALSWGRITRWDRLWLVNLAEHENGKKPSKNLIPNPDLSRIPVVRERVFEFNRGANQTTNDPETTFFGLWEIDDAEQVLRRRLELGLR